MSGSHDHHIQEGHPQSHAHGGAHGTGTLPFTKAEVEYFRRQDLSAGGAVVTLMTVIFSAGVAIYSVVAYVCSV